MLSLLRNYPGYTSALAFRLKPSVLRVPTRHFLTTRLVYSPAQKNEKANASSEASTVDNVSGAELNKNSADLEKEKPAKPRRLLKKDLKPPVKKPPGSFLNFVQEYRAKHPQDTDSFNLKALLLDASAAWRRLSEAEKQSYASSPEEYEAYTLAYKKWKDGLSPEVKKALKVRSRRKTGTGHALFVSETWKQTQGDTFGEKQKNCNAAWNSLSAEQKEDYTKRAATPFGIFLKRAKKHQNLLLKQEEVKARIEAKKQRERARKAAQKEKVQEKERALKEKKKALKAQVKAKALKEKKAKAAKALQVKVKVKALKEKKAKAAKALREKALREKKEKVAKALREKKEKIAKALREKKEKAAKALKEKVALKALKEKALKQKALEKERAKKAAQQAKTKKPTVKL